MTHIAVVAILPLDFGLCLLTAYGYINISHKTRCPHLVSELFNHCINVLFVTILIHRLCTFQVTAVKVAVPDFGDYIFVKSRRSVGASELIIKLKPKFVER